MWRLMGSCFPGGSFWRLVSTGSVAFAWVFVRVVWKGRRSMGRQQERVAARRAIHEARVARLQQQRERESVLTDLAVRVQVELRSGAKALAEAEARAGALIEEMVTVHGLTATQVAEWCAGGLSVREVGRLRRLTASTRDDQ